MTIRVVLLYAIRTELEGLVCSLGQSSGFEIVDAALFGNRSHNGKH